MHSITSGINYWPQMMRALVSDSFWAHICFTGRQKTEKKWRWRGVGGGWSWRGVQERRCPAADCWSHGSSTKCSTALQLEFRKKHLGVCEHTLVCHTFVFDFESRLTIDTRVCVCVCKWQTHHQGWQVWTTNEATDWRLVFVAKIAPIYPLFRLPDFKLFTLMDKMSYFPATLDCSIIKCQITVPHHSDRKNYYLWQIEH